MRLWGEYAPKALCCVDEYSHDDNPNWFDEQIEKEIKSQGDDIASYKVIDIEIDDDKLVKILNSAPEIKGEIKDGQ